MLPLNRMSLKRNIILLTVLCLNGGYVLAGLGPIFFKKEKKKSYSQQWLFFSFELL